MATTTKKPPAREPKKGAFSPGRDAKGRPQAGFHSTASFEGSRKPPRKPSPR
jgi:hypothetical protein